MAVESPVTAPGAGRKQPVADAPRALFEAVQRIGGGRLRRRPAMGRAREWRAA